MDFEALHHNLIVQTKIKLDKLLGKINTLDKLFGDIACIGDNTLNELIAKEDVTQLLKIGELIDRSTAHQEHSTKVIAATRVLVQRFQNITIKAIKIEMNRRHI